MPKDKTSQKAKTKVTVEKLKDSEAKLSIVVPKEIFEQSLKKVINKYNQELKVDGFRAGKIPTDVVERTVGSEKILYEGAEDAVKEAYVNAILDEKIQAIGEPKVEITKIAKGNDLSFVATVGVLPEIKFSSWDEELKKINQKFKGKKVEVEQGEVDKEVEFLANQRAKVVTVNTPAKKGNQVEVDFDVLQEGVPIENGSAKKQQIVIGEKRFIPGFEEKLLGAKAGEEKTFDLPFPKEYHAKHLAGKKATFEVKVNLVQEREIPKIDDKFASGIGKFKNLQELKANIKEGIEHEKKHKIEDQHKRELLDVVVEKTKLDVPTVLVDREIETMLHELDQDIKKIGLKREQYFEQMKTTEKELKQQWKKDQAPKRVKAGLAIREIAKKNKISPDAKEIEGEVNKVLQFYQSMGQVEDKLDMQGLYEAAKGNLTNQQVIKYLMEV